MGFLSLGTKSADILTVGYFATNGNLLAVDEEYGVGIFGDGSSDAIGKLSELIGKWFGPDPSCVACDFACDEMWIPVALCCDLVNDGISLVMSNKEACWGGQNWWLGWCIWKIEAEGRVGYRCGWQYDGSLEGFGQLLGVRGGPAFGEVPVTLRDGVVAFTLSVRTEVGVDWW